MADDPDGLYFPDGTPDEWKEAYRKKYQLTKMTYDDAVHSIVSVFGEVTKDQLKGIQTLLGVLVSSTNANQIANFWNGMAAAQMEIRFGVCSACGKDHGEELLAGINGDNS